MARIDRLKIFLDSMGGGAWPFLVGGVICLVNSVNERDLGLLNSYADPSIQTRWPESLAPPPGGRDGEGGGNLVFLATRPPGRPGPLPAGRSGRRPRFLEGLPAYPADGGSRQ